MSRHYVEGWTQKPVNSFFYKPLSTILWSVWNLGWSFQDMHFQKSFRIIYRQKGCISFYGVCQTILKFNKTTICVALLIWVWAFQHQQAMPMLCRSMDTILHDVGPGKVISHFDEFHTSGNCMSTASSFLRWTVIAKDMQWIWSTTIFDIKFKTCMHRS